MKRRFAQVDVFTDRPLWGNPLAVVVDGDGLSDEEMQRFANWTNLSETTFLVTPTDALADYKVRIFTAAQELPFAGHPTLGTCRVWLDHGGLPKTPGTVIQECGVGLVTLLVEETLQAFAAPPLIRSGDVDDQTQRAVADALRITVGDIVACEWIDNGPGWVGVLLRDAEAVLALEPDPGRIADLKIGVAGPSDGEVAIEVRAFFPKGASFEEDPVTGSLNASFAQWLLRSGRLASPYVARQGTRLGRDGRVTVTESDGEVWIGGDVVTCIVGTVEL